MTKRKAPNAGREYEIGYGKPPKHGQFQKGQPRPPRKAKDDVPDLRSLVAAELAVPISFRDEEGRQRRMSKAQVLAKQLVNEALKTGNPKHLRDFLPKESAAANDDFTEADLAIIARFLEEHRAKGGGDGND